MVLIEWIGNNS